MKVEYADRRLEAIESDAAAHAIRLPISVIRSFRNKINVLKAAPDERTLRNWKSLHYEKLKGRGNQRSIRLNKQWRLVFELTEHSPPTIVIHAIEDYH